MSEQINEFETEDDVAGTTELMALPAGDPMVDMQIATAKRYPRSVALFRKEAESLAILDKETAEECIYALKRGNKVIEGPSARLAEIIAYSWGNCRADAEVVEINEEYLVAQGTFFDLERNVAIRKKVQRRITDSNGRRYNADMIGVTGNAANSIALRNAVFAGVPKALWKQIYLKARHASLGQGGTLAQWRQTAFDWFAKAQVTPAQIVALLGLKGIEEITEEHLIQLNGIKNAIKEGETTVEAVFRPANGAAPSEGARDLNERIRQSGAAAAPSADDKAALEKKAAEARAKAEGEKQLAEIWSLLSSDRVSEFERRETLTHLVGSAQADWVATSLQLLEQALPMPAEVPAIVAPADLITGLIAGLQAAAQQTPTTSGKKSRARAAQGAE